MIEGWIIDPQSRGNEVDRVKFLYFQPIDNSVSPNYEEQGPRGSSEPHHMYSDTGPDTYTYDIRLAASVDQYDRGTAKKIYESYLFIKSFAYPDYGGGTTSGGLKVGPVFPPHQVLLQIGNFFRKRGIIKSPSFSLQPPYDDDGYPFIIDCRFTFEVVHDTPLDYRDIRRGK